MLSKFITNNQNSSQTRREMPLCKREERITDTHKKNICQRLKLLVWVRAKCPNWPPD